MGSYLKNLDYSVLQQCMHCGMCLPTCPTYDQTLNEKSSPRGRIALMRAVADDKLEAGPALAAEMSYCLGCLACETACPAGVDYTQLFENGRAEVESGRVRGGFLRKLIRFVLLRGLFFSQASLRFLGRLFYFYQAMGVQKVVRKSGLLKLLPKRLRALEKMTPAFSPKSSLKSMPSFSETNSQSRYSVALLTGCIQDVAFAQVNQDTREVLLKNDCFVWIPQAQGCCGSLHAHNGELEWARELARRNIEAVFNGRSKPKTLDAIITNAAGCGSHLKHYGRLLADDLKYAQKAKQWDSLVKDIHEFLVEINFKKPAASIVEANFSQTKLKKFTYHEACHLCHGQKITSQPRQILRSLPGYELVELTESTWCCGSAGVYNITQPESSAILLDRKMKHILDAGAEVIATANPGCILQIQAGAQAIGKPLRIVHPITLLAEAYDTLS